MVTVTLRYDRGQKLRLDDIYHYQDIGSLRWWEPVTGDGGEEIVITKDVDISHTEKATLEGVEGQINWRIRK